MWLYVKIWGINRKKNNNLIKEIPKNKQETIKQKINIEILDKDDIFKKFIEKCYDKERSRDYTSWRNMAFALKNSYDNDYAKNLLLLFIIIIIYCLGMNYLEKKYGLDN